MTPLPGRLGRVAGWYAARWVVVTSGIIAVAATGSYVVASLTGGVDPGSAFGLGFGIAAAVALLVVMLYSIRRALASVRSLGRTHTYLEVHLWGGALFLLLFLLHTDFGAPAGVFTILLWASAVWVVATGALGLLLQRWVPRMLRPTSSFEIHLRRIPELVGELRSRAEAAVAQAEPRVRAFYERELAADLAAPKMVTVALFGGPQAARHETPATDVLRRTLPEDGLAALDELVDIRATKREMDVHFTLQRLLRGWLYLHLPVAVVLLGLVVLHVFFTTYF